jgi:hypothetical protein
VRQLIDALSRYLMAGERVYGDDTEVPVLEPGLGRTRPARQFRTHTADDTERARHGTSPARERIESAGAPSEGLQ